MKLLGTDEPGGYTPLEVCRAEVEATRARIAELEARLRTLETQLVTSSNARVAAEADVARLREALERIEHLDPTVTDEYWSVVRSIAREALSGGGQEL